MATCNWTAEQLARALNATPRGTGWVAHCPAHEDSNPSLSIWPGDDGRAAYTCKATCEWKAVHDALQERVPDAFSANGHKPSTINIVATYDYTDADGNLVAQVCRLEPKSFRQRRPDPAARDGWTWKTAGLTIPLHHLPEVLSATAVFVVEGEKDVEAMRGIGLPATCNPGGAGKWRDHHTAALAGKRVCIIADKDKAGRAHADKVARALEGTAASVRVIEAADPHKDAADWIGGGATLDVIVAAAKAAPEWAPGGPETSDSSARPSIMLAQGELPRIVDEAEAAILAAPNHAGLYQRGGQIVRVVRLEAPDENRVLKRAAGTPAILTVPTPALVETLTTVAHWLKFDKRSEDWEPRDCPRVVAETYAARTGSWQLRPLFGVVDVPTLRPDGTVLQEPGYDTQTGLLLLERSSIVVPDAPGKEDAAHALASITEYLVGFPFAGEAAVSVAVAAILTACVRYAIPTAPMFLFDAPAAGTGKSLLADVVSLIAIGTPAASMSQAANPEEDAKRLFAVLLEGAPLVCIDNAARPFEGDALASILTQQTYRGRVLGSSGTVTVPTAATFLGTGNNLAVRGDLTRRVLLCRMDAGVENPEERVFEGDLRAEIRKARPRLVAAALTVLRAHAIAGYPQQAGARPYGSFEQWSAWVRHALLWLGLEDPCETRALVSFGDESIRQLDALLAAWQERFGFGYGTVNQLLKDPAPEVTEAVLDIAGDKTGHINVRRLGRWINANHGRICKGRTFAPGPNMGSRRAWVVREIESEG